MSQGDVESIAQKSGKAYTELVSQGSGASTRVYSFAVADRLVSFFVVCSSS